jgi:hypothetical protein
MASQKSKLNDNTIRIMDLVDNLASATTAGDTTNGKKRSCSQVLPQDAPNIKRIDTRTERMFCEDEIEACTMKLSEWNLGIDPPLDDGGVTTHCTSTLQALVLGTPQPFTFVAAPKDDTRLLNVNNHKWNPMGALALKGKFSARKNDIIKRMAILRQTTVDTYKRKIVESISVKQNVAHRLKLKKSKSLSFEKLMRLTTMAPVSPKPLTTATAIPAPVPAISTRARIATTITQPQAVATIIHPQATAAAAPAPAPAADSHTPIGIAASTIQPQAVTTTVQALTSLTETEELEVKLEITREQMIRANKAQMLLEEIQHRLKRDAEENARKERAEKACLVFKDVPNEFINRPVCEATGTRNARGGNIPQEDDTSITTFDQLSRYRFHSPSLCPSSTWTSMPMKTSGLGSSLELSSAPKAKRKFSIDLDGEKRSDNKRSMVLHTNSEDVAPFADLSAYTEDGGSQDPAADFVAKDEHGDSSAPVADSAMETEDGNIPAPAAGLINDNENGSSSTPTTSSNIEDKHGSSPASVANLITKYEDGNGDGDSEPQENTDTALGGQIDAEVGKISVWNKRYRDEDESQEAPETKRVNVSNNQEEKYEEKT